MARSPFLTGIHEHNRTYVDQGFVIKDFVASILPQQEWNYCSKTNTQNVYLYVLGKTESSQLVLTVHLLQDELTVPITVLCIAGMVVIT